MKLRIFLKEEGCFTKFPVAFNISVEHQEWEDNKDVLDDLMLSLKESAHSCDLKCLEEVSSLNWCTFKERRRDLKIYCR